MTTTIYGPHHLWALRTGSAERARTATPLRAHWPISSQVQDGPAFESTWEHAGATIAVRADCVHGDAAYLGTEAATCSPRKALEVAMTRGLHLHAAMLEDGMRRAGLVLGSFVLVLADWESSDHGLYVFGDRLMEAGRVEYRRSLRDLEQAVRDGWPGWSARGVQVLEIPE